MRATLWLALATITLEACATAPQASPVDVGGEGVRIAAVVDPVIAADMAASGIPGAAFVFVREGRIVYARGYGVDDLSAAIAVDPDRTVWPIASITKVITAVAALQLVDRGTVDLDADVNRYLRRLQVPSQGHGPLTLRHLLSHTAGLDELPGRQFDGERPPDPAGFLAPRLVRYRAPGKLTAYSTYGIALAGLLVEERSGQRYEDYVREHIFRPAGMQTARIIVRRGDEHAVATPYAIESGHARAMPHEFYVTTPTSSAAASASDMGRLLLALLADGSGGENGLLSTDLARAMWRQAATVHPEIPGWGLGLQLDRVHGVDIAEHGGDIGGFSALFVLIPEADAGFFIVHHGEGGEMRFRVKQALLDALFPPLAVPVVPPANPSEAGRLAEYAGRYLSSIACRSCPDAEVQAFTVTAQSDGSLALWGQRWLPLGGDLFVRDDGVRRIGFARDAGGRIVAVSGGSWRVADRIADP